MIQFANCTVQLCLPEHIDDTMPTRKGAAAKRKAPSSAQSSPAASSKKRTNKKKTSPKSVDGAPASSSSLLQRWAAGVAARLVPSTQLEQHPPSGGGEVEIDVEGAGRAAVDALPAGKLRTELRRDEEVTTAALRTHVEALRAKQHQQQQQRRQKSPEANRSQKKNANGPGSEKDRATPAVAGAAAAGGVVPCTVRLYREARAAAASGDNKLLQALAVNPRAPLDLLVDAVGASTSRDSTETLETAVAGMRTLAAALATDPKAAVSSRGVAFYAERAAVLASSATAAVTKGDTAVSKETSAAGGAAVAEACGFMLRILQVAGLAVNNTAAASARGADGHDDADGEEDGEPSSAAVTYPADRLLLPCSPEASSPPSDVVLAAAAAAAGAPATKPPPPPAHLSVARLLAHYAVTAAVCSTLRDKGPGGAAAAAAAPSFIRIARAIATGRGAGGRGDGSESDSSVSSSEGDDDDDNSSHGYSSSRTLSQHLSALCAAGLAGSEPATLEFLRCVGDAVCAVAPEKPAATNAYSIDDAAVRASLAPPCSRALARLPRPAASPPPTAAQFLKRAYAFRVVDTLNRSVVAASPPTSLSSKKTAVTALALSGGGGGGDGGVSRACSWDFVGAGAVSPPLLEFLERPEAAVAVGKGPARAAVEELAAARRRGDGGPAAVVELLRSSPNCATSTLSALLSAMERLEGVGDSGEGGGGGGVDGVVGGKAAPVAMGGFFLDTAGAGGAGAGAGTVLARLGSADDDVADVDEA